MTTPLLSEQYAINQSKLSQMEVNHVFFLPLLMKFVVNPRVVLGYMHGALADPGRVIEKRKK